MIHQCMFCNQAAKPVYVHGHYQCPVCHTNILPCCDGDNCETNQLLNSNSSSQINQSTKANESITPSYRITGGFKQ